MTAVEFLLRELRIEDLAKGEQLSVVLEICKQAKEMEKQQTEISDEIIDNKAKQINLKFGASFSNGFIMGVKWYREQLKM